MRSGRKGKGEGKVEKVRDEEGETVKGEGGREDGRV